MLSFTLNKVARLWTFGRGGHNLKGDPDGCKALWWKSSMRPEREEFLFMLLLSAPGFQSSGTHSVDPFNCTIYI